MIDFHTHILPAMDDGAKNQDEAVKLLSLEKEEGVDTVLLTPHYYAKKRSVEQFLEYRSAAFEKIKNEIPAGIDVRLGAEVHMTGINDLSDEELIPLAIEGTKCVLMEFPFLVKWSENLFDRVRTFAEETGYTPVIAHVERYNQVLDNPAILYPLLDAGCLLQVNTRAFIRKSTRRFAFAMLKKNMLHCIGSDAHNIQKRVPDIQLSKEAVVKAGYEVEWQVLQDYMRSLLQGKTLRSEMKRIRRVLHWYW
ncbi:MAG: hypothetical protein IJX88_04490 [Clostridia bacterium]|nr:hypothetical protein [Clostridia bacterium]